MNISDFKAVRRIFDKALENVFTKKDFIEIYNAYVRFEE